MTSSDTDPASVPAADATPILRARGVAVTFLGQRSSIERIRRQERVLRAVDGVDLDVFRGEALAVVGESGSGKSTLAKAVTGLTPLSAGSLEFEGRTLTGRRSRSDTRRIQMVFQDPYSSLNPRLTVGQILKELLKVHHIVPDDELQSEAESLLTRVGLTADALGAYPRQFSGGQRQRVAIARALALRPEVLVADEPVSALDVSVQATILNLLEELRAEMGLTLLFIAHNLAVVHHLCDRVAVMYLGRIVEVAPTNRLFKQPGHPYTRGLLEAIPRLTSSRAGKPPAVAGDPPSPLNIPSGCRFRTRCPRAEAICAEVDPPMLPAPGYVAATTTDEHIAACHFAFEAPGPRPVDGDSAAAPASTEEPSSPRP
ncbi:MAG TPA: ABC transporter ATP-binding protein [Mycobacteriales bacterium]|nr:ABC transporter ATP-binding protein [Mycobacteriales bacterium]